MALVLVCKQHPEGQRPELARFGIESQHQEFDPNQVNEGTNSAVVEREARESHLAGTHPAGYTRGQSVEGAS